MDSAEDIQKAGEKSGHFPRVLLSPVTVSPECCPDTVIHRLPQKKIREICLAYIYLDWVIVRAEVSEGLCMSLAPRMRPFHDTVPEAPSRS